MQAILQRRLVFFRLALLSLLLYGLTLGVAMVSPVVNPKILNLVCTSTGYKFISQEVNADNIDADNTVNRSMQGHLLDCSLCLPSGILLNRFDGIHYRSSHTFTYQLPPIIEVDFHSIISAALPARGPPTSIFI